MKDFVAEFTRFAEEPHPEVDVALFVVELRPAIRQLHDALADDVEVEP